MDLALDLASQQRFHARPQQVREVPTGVADDHGLPVDGGDRVTAVDVGHGREQQVVEAIVAVHDREPRRLPLEPALDARRERLEDRDGGRGEVRGVALDEHRGDELDDRDRLVAECSAHPGEVAQRRIAPPRRVQPGEVLGGRDELRRVASGELVTLLRQDAGPRG